MSRLPKVHTTGACISADERFRTRLWRIWSERPRLMFLGLNPSTAGPEVNDPTIEWLMTWASEHEFGGLEVCNLYAFRSAYPEELKAAGYLYGPDNDRTILSVAKSVDESGGKVVTGWGAKAQPNRAQDVAIDLALAGVPLYRWGVNANGSPKHPLYLKQSTPLKEWSCFA